MASFYHVYISPKPGVTLAQVEKVMNLAVDWFRYDNSNWIIYTTSDAKKWYSRLQKYVEPQGRILIVKLDTADHWGFMSKRLWEWIEKRASSMSRRKQRQMPAS